MQSIDPDIKQILDRRLAKGEISADQYQQISQQILGNHELKNLNSPLPQGAQLASIDDLFIYSTHIQVANHRKEFSEVLKADGGMVSVSINIIPSVKHSWISIMFENGDSYYMDEDRHQSRQ